MSLHHDTVRGSATVALAAVVALWAVSVSCGRGREATDQPPNVLLVVVDSLRRDHVGAYGYDVATTPAIDRLASGGTLFRKTWAQSPRTLESSASLLTSSWRPLLGAALEPSAEEAGEGLGPAARNRLLAGNTTVAEAFVAAGYQTTGIFTSPHHHPASGFWQGFEDARFLSPRERHGPFARAGRVRQAFLDWYDQVRGGGPWMAYLHFMDASTPQRPPPEIRREFLTSDDPTERRIQKYDAAIRLVDETVAEILEDLQQRDAAANLVIAIVSVNGAEPGLEARPRNKDQRSLAPARLEVPLIFGGTSSGLQAGTGRDLSTNLDVAPTLLALAGIDPPRSFRGRNLLKPLDQEQDETDQRRESFAWIGSLRSLTVGRWHVISDQTAQQAGIYDLRSDPSATRDLAETETKRLALSLRRLDAYRRDQREARAMASALDALQSDGAEVDPDLHEKMKTLGYFD